MRTERAEYPPAFDVPPQGGGPRYVARLLRQRRWAIVLAAVGAVLAFLGWAEALRGRGDLRRAEDAGARRHAPHGGEVVAERARIDDRADQPRHLSTPSPYASGA